jgi:hypothetical protein
MIASGVTCTPVNRSPIILSLAVRPGGRREGALAGSRPREQQESDTDNDSPPAGAGRVRSAVWCRGAPAARRGTPHAGVMPGALQPLTFRVSILT